MEDSDEFLVDIENREGSSRYRIIVDGLEPITIKRCAMLSRYISKQLEEDLSIDEDDNYIFEVSSPGAERPLKDIRQYPKHIGRQLDIVLKDETHVEGTLKEVEGEKIKVVQKVSKKETSEHWIELGNIKQANVIISFK